MFRQLLTGLNVRAMMSSRSTLSKILVSTGTPSCYNLTNHKLVNSISNFNSIRMMATVTAKQLKQSEVNTSSTITVDDHVAKINGYSWALKAINIRNHDICNVALANFDRLNIDTIACGVANNKTFAEAVAVTITHNNNIGLYMQLCNYYCSYASDIMLNISHETNKHLSKFLFQHFDTIRDQQAVVEQTIFQSKHFCQLVFDACMTDIMFLNDLTPYTRRTLFYSLSDDCGQVMFNDILANLTIMSQTTISDCLTFNYKFVDNNTSFNDKFTKHIINNKNGANKLLKSLTKDDLNVLLRYPTYELWSEYTINNFDYVWTTNRKLVKLLSSNNNFNTKVINHLHTTDTIVNNFPYIVTNHMLDLSSWHMDKLQQLCLKHQTKLGMNDIIAIVSRWPLLYMCKFCNTLIDNDQHHTIRQIMPIIKQRDYSYANSLSYV